MATEKSNETSIETGAQRVTHIPPGEGESVWAVGDTYTFKTTSEDSNGKFTRWKETSPPRADGPPDVERMAAVAETHHTEIPPPPGE